MSIENYKRLYNELLIEMREFSSGPVVKTSPSNAGDVGSIPVQETKVPHALGPKNQNLRQKQHCNKYNEDLQKWSTLKKNLKKKRDEKDNER